MLPLHKWRKQFSLQFETILSIKLNKEFSAILLALQKKYQIKYPFVDSFVTIRDLQINGSKGNAKSIFYHKTQGV